MSFLEAVLLGVVQGFTEWLPISSTAHLMVFDAITRGKDAGAAFTAVIQLGTLLACIIYFRRDIARLLLAWFQDLRQMRYGTSHDARLAWMIIVGTIPVVFFGLVFKKYIRADLRNLYVVGTAAIVFALLLFVAEKVVHYRAARGRPGRGEEEIGWKHVMMMGCFQVLALIPGASRSGTTITAGLFAGLTRSAAARFSFLLSLPAVFGAGVHEFMHEYGQGNLSSSSISLESVLVATVVSGIVGYASIAGLLYFLRKNTTYIFIVYRILFGSALLIAIWQGYLNPTQAE